MILAIIHNLISSALARLLLRWWRRFLMVARRPAPRPPSAWRACSVHRWHTHPLLCGSGDRIDAHSARVAVLILQFAPDAPARLLRAAITHDLGEALVGDLPGPVKRHHPAISAAAAQIERAALVKMGFAPPDDLDERERLLLALCDGLDAYLWAVTHRPEYVRAASDWRAMFARLKSQARALGVLSQFECVVSGVCDVS